jgi:hypothetical protein
LPDGRQLAASPDWSIGVDEAGRFLDRGPSGSAQAGLSHIFAFP